MMLRLPVLFLCLLFLSLWVPIIAEAQSPFGVGMPGQPLPLGSKVPTDGVLGWIWAQQATFYQALTGLVGALKSDPLAFWGLAGLSFLYGVFHAAGPGHGKVIVSSYVLADGQVLRRGIVLAVVSSLAQAVTAVAVVSVLAFALNMTSLFITRSAEYMALSSYILVSVLGLWLIWQKILRPWLVKRSQKTAHQAHHSHADQKADHHRPHSHGPQHDDHNDHQASGDVCSTCGHNHAPDPSALKAGLWTKEALTVVLSVGLRPCSGALIVLIFALSQDVYLAGIGAAFAMALGTGFTVSTLASMAVGARHVAVSVVGASGSDWAHHIHRSVEAIGAVVVFLFGILLTSAALSYSY